MDRIFEYWASLCRGLTVIIRLDQESRLTASVFRSLVTAHEFIFQFLGLQSHNSIGIGKCFHASLHLVFGILRAVCKDIEPEATLCYFVKRLNDTMVPYGLVLP